MYSYEHGSRFTLEMSLVEIFDHQLMAPCSAQLPISVHRGLCRRFNIYLGTSFRVRGSPYSGSQMISY